MELEIIKSKIHELRGFRIMLDFDLAELYQVETKRLKEAVRRNINRFPSDFIFELTKDEITSLRSQNATLEKGRGKFSKYLPFAFTEQGVAMLSSVLNSDISIKINIQIIRAFVFLRQYALSHDDINNKLALLESKYDQRFEDIDAAIHYLINKDKNKSDQAKRNKIGYKNSEPD
jgi:hypothetical protein